jgi:hypothetical protein
MTKERTPLTFAKPGVPGAPANVVVVTTIQVVDGSGVAVSSGTGRAVTPYETEGPWAELDGRAQSLAELGLHLAAPEAEAVQEAREDLTTLTKAELQARLEEQEIEYPAKATKEELVGLLVGGG